MPVTTVQVRTYRLYSYDVWGNERDGFEVNDCYRSGDTVQIPDNASDKQVVQIMKAAGWIKKGLHTKSVEIDGETPYTLYFSHRQTGRPEFEARCEDDHD